jgi:DNA-binding beta-propeller fold protein YncE
MRIFRMTLSYLGLLVLAGGLLVLAQTHWTVAKTFHIGGEGGWDYVTVDAPRHRLFVTRSTHTMAIDTVTGKVLADIPGQIRSHGVALVPKLNRGFITDGGGSGAILVFNMKTYKVLGRIPTMPDSDGIIYDAALNRILAVSGDGNALMIFNPDIDPKSGKIDPPIDLGGSPEFLASDASGRVYINLPDKNEVAVVDVHTRKVIARWPVAPGGKPVGMAIDRAHHLLFIGCRGPQKLIVMSTENGKIVAALPIGSGNDAVRYFNGQAFASCRDGSLTVVDEKAGKFVVEQKITTAEGARTQGLDKMTHEIFLPTAKLEPSPTGLRPRMKPGTFEIVVVKGG